MNIQSNGICKIYQQTYWKVDELDFYWRCQDLQTRPAYLRVRLLDVPCGYGPSRGGCKETFWGALYKHFPKPEFNNMGATFAENETAHLRHTANY